MSRFVPLHVDRGGGDVKGDDDYKLGFKEKENYVYRSGKGLSVEVVKDISEMKSEPAWMREFRLKSLNIFESKEMPTWGADLSELNFDEIHYYTKPTNKEEQSWEEVPDEIKRTYERIGVPEAEKEYLAGSKFQYESEVVYGSLMESLRNKGVIYTSMDQAVRDYPELVQKYFGTVIPPGDNKFAALNSAVWSGGSFIYVPRGVQVEKPLQAYFRINSELTGQFERTLIIAEEGSSVHYVEGCSAPKYSKGSLHSAVVEIVVHKKARVQYTTIQNWYKNVYNLVTKRMKIMEEGQGVWVDCNLGSKITMKYPSCFLMGRRAHGEVISLAFAGEGQHQDAGAKMMHLAPETTSLITSKSISKAGGRTSYRGMVHMVKGAKGSKSKVVCDALILDGKSRSDTYPTNRIMEEDVRLEHEATVSKIGEEQLFYLMSRGMSEEEANSMIINGFASPVIKNLPMEYAVELNRLMDLEMEGSVG